MASDRVAWPRRRPNRAAGRLAWTGFVGMAVTAAAWLLFGNEPWRTNEGAVNPLAMVPALAAVLFGAALVPQVVALVRRPEVAADHYALVVRPGVGRTLVLPWAQVAELAAVELDEEQIMLVRCLPQRRVSGDRPRWWDQFLLRSVIRGAAFASAYDLAVPMEDFIGEPESLLGELARRAPAHVVLVRRGAPATRRSDSPPD